ncbi:hypothetical protein CP8484711_1316, partial [Chlamydia psittaci 84-8471/1]
SLWEFTPVSIEVIATL